jgi:hypothetical protein
MQSFPAYTRVCITRPPPRALIAYVFLRPSDAAPGRLNFAPFITWRCHCTVRQRVLKDLIIVPRLFVISRRSLHRYTMRKRLPVSVLLLQQVAAFVPPALRNVHKSRAPWRHNTANKQCIMAVNLVTHTGTSRGFEVRVRMCMARTCPCCGGDEYMTRFCIRCKRVCCCCCLSMMQRSSTASFNCRAQRVNHTQSRNRSTRARAHLF